LFIHFALLCSISAALVTIFQNLDASYPNVKVILLLLNPELELTSLFQCAGTNFTTGDAQQLSGTIPPLGTQGCLAEY